MNRLEELLEQWRDGVLADAKLAELNRLLVTPEARARLRDVVQFDAALLEGLRETPWLQLAETVTRSVESRPTQTHRRFAPSAFGFAALRPWLLPLAACFVALIAVAAWLAWRPVVSLGAVHGTVTVVREGKIIPAMERLTLHAGDVVRTAAGAGAQLQWRGETTRVELLPNTETRLNLVKGDKHLTLLSGTLTAQVAKQSPGHPMVLQTSHGRVEVIGTRFELTTTTNKTRVEVTSGRVLFSGGNQDNGYVVEALQVGEMSGAGEVEVEALPVSETVDMGLLAHWPLTEGTGDIAHDVSGNGRDATLQNPAWTTGENGVALAFAGVGSQPLEKRSFLRTPELHLPASFTITLWVKPEQTESTGHNLQALFANTASFGPSDDGFFFLINRQVQKKSSDDQSLCFRAGDGHSNSGVISPARAVRLGGWQFIAVNVNQTTGRIDVAVNGVAVFTQSSIVRVFRREAPLWFGALSGDFGLPLCGSLRDIRIYERLLDPDEIHRLSGQ